MMIGVRLFVVLIALATIGVSEVINYAVRMVVYFQDRRPSR